jgi:cysteine-rich repeat protein
VYLVQSDPGNPNPVEECDDGDLDDNDTCTNDCKFAICGDGVIGPGESCDDGNNIDGDGCGSDCAPIECGSGLGANPTQGIPCDDGNSNNSDSCLDTCVWNSCGDGFTLAANDDPSNPNPVEQCDDGNASNFDDCLDICVLNTCGDGYRNPRTEDCDLGALNGVASTCTVTCRVDECDGARVSAGEDCDEGDGESGDSCLPTCIWNQCGDGAVYTTESDPSNPNPIEECDDANQDDTDSCTSQCTYNVCGDGKVFLDRTEPYDDPDGNGIMTASRLGMNADAAVVPAWNFSPLDVPFEECDDGNDTNGDGCQNDCTLTP